ncbi:hypothetical protein [Sphingobacterium corticibacterium]|uniref:Uncharacterized protein n=1 Tax=Sphingobacterium corticibacterium TaxID=2484746 RepID=A0A4Q6XR32_9SPHI|nr:hypothetical protein [Sphingobacterium corticibacterium]RZF59894.1 hypothetical protein EWE74_12215 [Sphingobacterium corticibacterium]
MNTARDLFALTSSHFVLTKDFFSLLRYLNALLSPLNTTLRDNYTRKKYLDIYTPYVSEVMSGINMTWKNDNTVLPLLKTFSR